jgi:hypothetical protein
MLGKFVLKLVAASIAVEGETITHELLLHRGKELGSIGVVV